MAIKASGSSVKFNICIQAAQGTAATTMQQLKSVTQGETLNSSATELTSAAITPIRDVAGIRNGLYSVSGSTGIEISDQGTEIFYQLLLGNKTSVETSAGSGIFKKTYTRSSNIPYATFERIYSNMSPLQVQLYTDVKINQIAYTFDPTALVTGATDWIGVRSDAETAAITDTPTVYDHIPFAGIDVNITINGVATKVLKGSLTITNALEASNVLGSQYADDVVEGLGEVSGSFDMFFTDRTEYDLFNNEAIFPITITMTKGADTHVFTIPNAKFSGNRDTNVSTDKALVETYTFKGIQSADINGAIKIEVTNATP